MKLFSDAPHKAPPGFERKPFEAIPLISVLMTLFTRPRQPPVPDNPDWERDEPMTGLS